MDAGSITNITALYRMVGIAVIGLLEEQTEAMKTKEEKMASIMVNKFNIQN
jgi:hypothetical protein